MSSAGGQGAGQAEVFPALPDSTGFSEQEDVSIFQTYARQRKLTGGAASKQMAAPVSGQTVPNSAVLSSHSGALPKVQQRVQPQIS